ncbi:uncharacterized protein BT62DRAFT_1078771 [Guyanagaster necrorhizus]|uniref:Uncharacterized protein n=1 Tax=Guyanagaster necrorhizus TaxID=856835 RepID=A0A9P7VKY7_9AGAR|nr:uncharacterized protein BT62DRAFT_1078771 [Guyanagaster necrorhizus MCA 3950]KAG7443038.1 hypothetical protein BT62DRAFT_1078771 [Guyanagaster necrorhizus MCA 3950]
MGGGAFTFIGPFPRLSRDLYAALKARHTAALGIVYTQVCTPIEAPEKQDHGDIDFLVYSPEALLPSHDTVKGLLGAAHVLPMPGPRTSNYAIAIPEDEFNAQMHEGWYQVDVHVCGSPEEFARVRFFHSYGDMGMILGLVARHSGLHLGVHGLKYPNPPNPGIMLSTDFDVIADFIGCDMKRYEQGFTTKRALFEWVAKSRFFTPRMFGKRDAEGGKIKQDRKMYWEFVAWAQSQPNSSSNESPAERQCRIREEALRHFGKQIVLNVQMNEITARSRLKAVFNGKIVAERAEMGTHWRGVKMIMDRVREQCGGGDESVLKMLDNEEDGEKKLMQMVIQAREDLGFSKTNDITSGN